MARQTTWERFRSRLDTLYAPRSRGTRLKVSEVCGRLEALGVTSPRDLTPALAAEFAAALPANANTARGQLGYLRTVYLVAREDGLIRASAVPNWKRLRPPAARPTRNPVLSREQVGRLLAWQRGHSADWRGRRIFGLTAAVALTGLRRDEALYLRRGDYDWGRSLLHVTGRDDPDGVKTPGSVRSVPVCPELREVLRAWVPYAAGSPWLFPGASLAVPWVHGEADARPLAWLQRSARAAGVGHVTWHGLRHSFATIALRDWRLPLWAVSKILGHSSVKTTERYLHLDDPDALVSEVSGVGFGTPPGA